MAHKRIDKINILLQVIFSIFHPSSQIGSLQTINIPMSLEIIIVWNSLCGNGIIKLRNFVNAYNTIDIIDGKTVIDINITDGRRILQLFIKV